jgi:decaprenyl-phosphate phosphoribosyltransferase
MRPKQWIKNSLLFVGYFLSGQLLNFAFFRETILAFLAFCLISSLGYLFNDWVDRENDSLHPRKRTRVVASGLLKLKNLLFLAILLMISIFILSFFSSEKFKLFIMLITYLLLTFTYSAGVKNIPVLEMIFVGFFFFLRTFAGPYIIGLKISEWFLLVTAFSSLFIIASKRYSEICQSSNHSTRKVLARYDKTFLDYVLNVSSSAAVISFSLWAFSLEKNQFLAFCALIPFLYTIFKYRLNLITQNLESPEEALFKDKGILLSFSITGLLIFMALYVKS